MAYDKIYSIKDGSIWESEIKHQYDDQPDWSSYQVRNFNMGLQRLPIIEIPGYPNITKDEIYLTKQLLEQSRIEKDKQFYIVNNENPNGKFITAGEVTEIKGLFREYSSFEKEDEVEPLVVYSFAKPMLKDGQKNYANINFDDILYKIPTEQLVTKGTYVQEADSPFENDENGLVLKTAADENGNVEKVQLNLFDQNIFNKMVYSKDRFTSIFFKPASDNLEEDDLLYRFATGSLSSYYYSGKKKYIPYFCDIFQTTDNKLRIRFGYFDSYTENYKYPANDDENAYDVTTEDVIFTKDQYHSIIVQLTSDGRFIVFVNNKKVLDGHNSKAIQKTNENSDWRKEDYRYTLLEFFSKTIGNKFAQFEYNIGVYNTEEYYDYINRKDEKTIYKIDISGNKLESAPSIIYRISNNKLYCSLAPDDDSIDNNWDDQYENQSAFNIKEEYPIDNMITNNLTYFDRITYNYDVVFKKGRSFQFKITSDVGDMIYPDTYIYLNA